MRGAAAVLVLALAAGLMARAQARQCVTLRIDIPQHDTSREISTPEGKATAVVQIKDADRYPTFYLDLIVRDVTTGLVLVTIRTDRTSERAVDEFELRPEGGTIQTATMPPFQLSVLRVFERTGDTCR